MLYIDTMDWTPGTIWYSVHKTKICTAFLKILDVDVLGLGCNEMFEGNISTREKNFWDYINSICEKTILCANCDIADGIQGSTCISKSKVFDFDNTKVGVTAYVHRTRVPGTTYKHIKFTDEAEAVNQEIEQLERQGINIIIVVGHGHYLQNKEVLSNLKNVDLFVAGHSRLLFYNGKPPEGKSSGPYPEKLKNANGDDVLVLYTGHHGLYVGTLAMTFDDEGKIVDYVGNPAYMDESIKENETALKLLETFVSGVDEFRKKPVGKSRVYLELCNEGKECNLGNLLTDALIHYQATEWAELESRHWTDTAIAFVNSATIKFAIEAQDNDTIFMSDLMSCVPYNNAVYVGSLNGTALKQVLEYSAETLSRESPGSFLQVSGLHITYDISKPINEKIISLRVRCADCAIPQYEELKDEQMYNVITIQYLRFGGDGYTFGDSTFKEVSGVVELDVLKAYVRYCHTVQIGREERIKLINTNTNLVRSRSSEYANKTKSGNLLFFTCMYVCVSMILT